MKLRAHEGGRILRRLELRERPGKRHGGGVEGGVVVKEGGGVEEWGGGVEGGVVVEEGGWLKRGGG